MPDTDALAHLGKRIAQAQGWPAAKAFKAYHPSDRDKAVIAAKAGALLKILPRADDAAAEWSAAFAVHLERDLAAPVQVVTGDLTLVGAPRFAPIAHAWLMIGAYVADITILRMAYAGTAPAPLFHHVHARFGPDQGLLFAAWRETRRIGFDYAPRHVLASAEIDDLLVRARALIAAPAR